MTTKQVFKAHLPSVNYIFQNGKPAIFVLGRYVTSVDSEIAELKAEIAAGHPHIYIDANEETTDAPTTSEELMQGLRAQIEAQVRAEMAAAVQVDNDMGSSDQAPVVPASTQAIAEAAAGGSGAPSPARLVNLAAVLANKSA